MGVSFDNLFLDHFYENCYSGIFIKSSKSDAVVMVQNGHFYFVQLFLDIFGHFWTFLDIFPMKKLLQRIFIKSSKSDAVRMVQNGHFYFQVFFEIVAANFYKKFEKRCSGDGAKWTFLFSGLFWNCCSGFFSKVRKLLQW
jgi:hypothetical protein